MLGYRFPAAYQNRGAAPAVLERNVLKIGDDSELRLGKFIGSGMYGMVFLDAEGKVVVKFETNPDGEADTMEYLMDINHWASEFDVGPRFGNWGPLTIDKRQLTKMKAMVLKNRPRWFDEANPGQIYYSVYEKWDDDLYNYLIKGDVMKRFNAIPFPVMERFVARITKLHGRGVVHLDLAAKNVFIRVKNDIVQDMVLGDYGLSRPRISWFFEDDDRFRTDIVNYYGADPIGWLWANHMDKVGDFNAWIRNEPFNSDWCLVGTYALANGWFSMIERLEKMPPVFNFSLPWDSRGWLRVTVRNRGQQVEIDVHGLMSLAHLRDSLKGQDKFQMNSLNFEGVAIKDERKRYPSDVIRQIDGDLIITLKARRAK
jgi:hypothetical protein